MRAKQRHDFKWIRRWKRQECILRELLTSMGWMLGLDLANKKAMQQHEVVNVKMYKAWGKYFWENVSKCWETVPSVTPHKSKSPCLEDQTTNPELPHTVFLKIHWDRRASPSICPEIPKDWHRSCVPSLINTDNCNRVGIHVRMLMSWCCDHDHMSFRCWEGKTQNDCRYKTRTALGRAHTSTRLNSLRFVSHW